MDTLPVELVEFVIQDLDLATVRNLRLVCQELRQNVTATRRFIRCCTWKRVELKADSLQNLERTISESPAVAGHLQHLVVVGVLCLTAGLKRTIRDRDRPFDITNPIAWPASTSWSRIKVSRKKVEAAKTQLAHFERKIKAQNEERASGRDVRALTSLFSALRAHSRTKGLKGLALDVVVYREKTTLLQPHRGAVPADSWPLAAHVFSAAMQAWHSSGLSVEHFNAFGYLDACCIQMPSLTVFRPRTNILHGLKALTLSLSNGAPTGFLRATMRDPDEDPKRLHPVDNERQVYCSEEDQQLELVGWLHQCPNLERLDLTWYRIRAGTLDFFSTDMSESILQNIAHLAPLPHLTNLRLRHFCVQIQDILKFLDTSPKLHSLDLRETTLLPSRAGTLSTFFTGLTSRLSNIHLDNLFVLEEQSPQFAYISCYQFAPDPDYIFTDLGCMDLSRHTPAAYGANALCLKGRGQVLEGIKWRLVREWGSVQPSQNLTWLMDRRGRYGWSR